MAQSYAKLKDDLNIDNGAGWGPYAKAPLGPYMRAIEDDMQGVKLSFNYYTYISRNVTLNVDATGQDALTDTGKSIYTSNYSDFGIQCGDDYVSFYEEGGLLLMSLVLDLDSPVDMNNFVRIPGQTTFKDIN